MLLLGTSNNAKVLGTSFSMTPNLYSIESVKNRLIFQSCIEMHAVL